jgi:Ca2+/Na+ antiporter
MTETSPPGHRAPATGSRSRREKDAAAAGLPGAPEPVHAALRSAGIDPDRLSILHLGHPGGLARLRLAPWVRRMALGFVLWAGVIVAQRAGVPVAPWASAGMALVTGLLILQAACDALVTTAERLAARLQWDHYVAGTVAEILSTLPELVVIAFVVPVSPLTAFVIALITIYNNALVFSLYSYFLPKDQQGKFLMPKPITEAGTQILIAGAAIGLILGLVMLTLASGQHPKRGFEPHDLIAIGVILLMIFAVYLFKLVKNYASEEQAVRDALALTPTQVDQRRDLVYRHVQRSSLPVIALLFLAGVAGALVGGERVAEFAHGAIDDLGLNSILTALILAVFAGMSEYVILWKSHRKHEYGIALANAFGGITQVMFLVLPFTLLCIGVYQGWLNPSHAELPLEFTLSNILLLLFLFPTFFVLVELLEEDHTLGVLDTTIMTAIFLLLIVLLVTYGADNAALEAGR